MKKEIISFINKNNFLISLNIPLFAENNDQCVYLELNHIIIFTIIVREHGFIDWLINLYTPSLENMEIKTNRILVLPIEVIQIDASYFVRRIYRSDGK